MSEVIPDWEIVQSQEKSPNDEIVWSNEVFSPTVITQVVGASKRVFLSVKFKNQT